MDYMGEFEDVLRRSLGNKLFTPSDMLRDYESFGAMRRADDWCKVSDMLGKVLVLLHETGITEDYIKTDPSIKTQVMFPMLREKDIELNEIESKIERLFGPNISDLEYFEKARLIFSGDIISITKDLVNKLYEVKDKNLIKLYYCFRQ